VQPPNCGNFLKISLSTLNTKLSTALSRFNASGAVADRFVTVDRNTFLLFPPDMRDWVRENHLGQFILEAVKKSDSRSANVNQ
jgi:hypothetical protein